MIINLSNILKNCENNENLINTFIEKFDNITNIFKNNNLEKKFHESINFCTNIFDFEIKEKPGNSKECLKMNYMFNSVFIQGNAPIGLRQNKLNQILLNNNENSLMRNNNSRISHFIKTDNKNNNNNNINPSLSEKNKKKLIKSNSLNNISNPSKYTTNSNANYGFIINLNNPPNENENTQNDNTTTNNINKSSIYCDENEYSEYTSILNEETEVNNFVNDSFSQKQNFFNNILNISNLFSYSNWRLLIIFLEQLIKIDFLFEEYKFLLKFNNFLMHLWKEEEFSNTILNNTIFKCFPFLLKFSPKNERENLHKIIQKDIVENKSFYVRRLFFPYFESCLNIFSLNYILVNHIFDQFLKFFDDNYILICICFRIVKKFFPNFENFEEENKYKIILMTKIKDLKNLENVDNELKKVKFFIDLLLKFLRL